MAIFDLTLDGITQRAQNFHLQSDQPGLVGLDGREQVVFTENRRWTTELRVTPKAGQAIGNLLATGDELRGRVNVLRVEVCNSLTLTGAGGLAAIYAAAGISADDVTAGFIPFSDGSTFSDGAGFALPDASDPVVTFDAPGGASTVWLDGYLGRQISRGAVFSHDDYLYRVSTNSDGVVTFNPPLRAALSAGDMVKVNRPTVLLRLAKADGWSPFVDVGRISAPMTVKLVEVFER